MPPLKSTLEKERAVVIPKGLKPEGLGGTGRLIGTEAGVSTFGYSTTGVSELFFTGGAVSKASFTVLPTEYELMEYDFFILGDAMLNMLRQKFEVRNISSPGRGLL